MGKSNKSPSQTLKGFRDLGPEIATAKKATIDTLWQHATLAGFQPIETPVLEYAETLLGTGNTETDKEVYLFEDHGRRNIGLRFDLTVPFSRYVAANLGTMVLPFKKFQVGHSFRGEKPQKGRYREFCQADFDIVGVDSMSADVEVLSQLANSLEAVAPAPATFFVSHRAILSRLIARCLPRLVSGGESAVLIAIDKLLKIGETKVLDLVEAVEGADRQGAADLLRLLTARSENGDTDLTAIKQGDDSVLAAELERFERTVSLARKSAKLDRIRMRIDLSIARGLGYYTGIVFEAMFDSHPGYGSIAAGGRYNELVSRFSSQEVPGVGGTVGVDRLLGFAAGEAQQQVPPRQGIFIAIADESAREYGFEQLRRLRELGYQSSIDLKQAKLQGQFKYADRSRFAKVIVIGADEMATQMLNLKDLDSGQELKNIPAADIPNHLG